MAARKASAPASTTDNITTEDVLRSIFETTIDGKSSLFAVVEDLGIDSGEVLTLLENVSDDFLDSDSKGNLWFPGDYFDANDMLSKYNATHAAPAAEPIQGKDGKNITVPVSEDSSERRELDAAQGERVLGEDDMRTLINSTRNIPAGWVNDGGPTHYVDYDPTSVNGHMLLPEPETLDAPPEGINQNIWELYKAANTAPARLFWAGKVAEQMAAHKAAKEAAAQAPEVVPTILPIDPVTGLPLSL